ncbi:hypothetical protein [Photobacterium gaetbulicola]|nr:hypothetical protein [Photobacterium gaetbulicola]
MINQETGARCTLSPDASCTLSFNPVDEGALALLLKANQSLQLNMATLTIADQRGDALLQRLIANGYQHAIRIEPPHWPLEFAPRSTAAIIADFAKQQQIPWIVVGPEQGGAENHETGFLLAELLGYPCIQDVVEIQQMSHTEVELSCQHGNIRQRYRVKGPSVWIAHRSVAQHSLPVPTLMARMKSRDQKIIHHPMPLAVPVEEGRTVDFQWIAEPNSSCRFFSLDDIGSLATEVRKIIGKEEYK